MEPILLVGVHRSGTTLMTRLLEQAGLFVGRDLEENHESEAFIRLNRKILRLAGATWNRPERVRDVIDDPDARAIASAYLQASMRNRCMASYMGWPAFLRHGGPAGLKRPWGWKDPRNSVTLPLWLDVFPDAKVIRIRRHGVDVAKSLMVRYERSRAAATPVAASRTTWLPDPKFPFKGVHDLQSALETWATYVEALNRNTAGLGDRVLDLRYEELLQDPHAVMQRAMDFCGLEAGPGLAQVIASIDPSRAFAYKSDPELAAFAASNKKTLALAGYEP